MSATTSVLTDPASTSAAAVRDAEARLAAVRQRARIGILVEAVAALALLLAGYALLTLVVDRNLRLEWPFRAVLLAGFAVLAARTTWRRLLLPWRVQLDADEMALAVERRAPGLRQALISSLQFGRTLAADAPTVDSRELMAVVVDEVRGRLASLPFAAAIDAARVRRFAGLLAACVAGFAGWGLIDGQSLAIWAQRNLALSSVPWPVFTHLRFLDADGGTVRLPQGDPLTVRVAVNEPAPSQVFLHYTYKTSATPAAQDAQGRPVAAPPPGEDGSEPMSRTGDGEFTLTLESVLANCDLVAEGGDGESEPLHVLIVERPRIQRLQVDVVFPEYMHKANETVLHRDDRQPDAEAQVITEGEVRLVRGSELVCSGWSHKPIRSAFALLGDEKIPFTLDGDGHSFAGKVVPAAGALLEVNVIDADQLGAGAPPRLLIRIVDDKPPTIDLKLRGISSLITIKAVIPGDLKVKDDFGISAVGAEFRAVDDQAAARRLDPAPKDATQPAGQDAAADAFEPFDAVFGEALSPGDVRYETTASIDLLQVNPEPEKEDSPDNKVRPGMLLSVRYWAKDNFGPGDPHLSRGEVLSFRVVTRDKLLEELRRRQVEQRQEAERILDEERMAAMELKENANPVTGGDKAAQVRVRYKTLARQQQALGRRVAFVGDIYQRILWEYENNRVLEPAKIREMESLITVPLDSLAKEPFPATARQVDEFSTTGDEATRSSAVEGYADIVARLEAIIKVMEQAETLAALLEHLRNVIKTQGDAQRAVERRLQEAGENTFGGQGKDPGTGKDPNEKPKKK